MKNILFASLLIAAFIFSACDDDDATDTGSFKVTLSGTEKVVTVTKATVTVASGTNSTTDQPYHKLNIEGAVGDDTITIMVSNWDFQEPPDNAVFAKDYYNNEVDHELEVGEKTETCMRTASQQMTCEGVLISYLQGDKTYWSFQLIDTVVLSVEKCDGQRVSGTFDITLANPYDETESMVVKGTFTNLPYTVRNI
jgi:hypothetical protein